MNDFIVFGDSITYGFYDTEGGWAGRLRHFLDQRTRRFEDPNWHYVVYNLGVDAESTRTLLGRFESEARSRFYWKDKYVIIFSVGIADSSFVKQTGRNLVTPAESRRNIRKLIHIAKKLRRNVSNVVFIGLTPCDEKKTTPFAGSANKVFVTNKEIEKYDKLISEICKEEDVGFIEIMKKFKPNNAKLLADGLHPNSKGHELIFKLVKDYLLRNGMIELRT